MEIVKVPIKSLKQAEYNPRKMSDKEVKDLTESIRKFGLVEPIVVNKHKGRENVVVGGHQRLKIAISEGFKEMPVVYVDLNERSERELNLRLNKNLGQWDWDMLANFEQEELLNVGFDNQEIEKMIGYDPDEKDDEVPEVPQEPKAKLGDIYQLGRHRIMCGDSTKKEDVERLMNGQKANMVFTDPPYNVNYSGRGKETNNTIENDNLEEEEFRIFLRKVFENYKDNCKENTPLYCCYASKTHREFEDELNKNNWEVINQIIWVKLVASMGWGDYRWKHEPIFYCRQKGSSLEFYGDRREYTEWKEEKNNEQLLIMLKSMIKKEEDGNSTVWRFHRDSNYKHPTQKPIDLITKAIKNSSQQENIVLDLFLGSGSTLIACEKTNRICYGMELEPKYIDVIIKRYEDYTGKKAELIK